MTKDRFLCKLEDFDPEQHPDLDCNNYCFTDDQQCNGTDMGNATCADIQCNGDGNPTCTDLCTIDYSLCEAGGNELTFELTVITQERGTTTNWALTKQDKTVFEVNRYRNFETNTTINCFERECYGFTLSNTKTNVEEQIIQYSLKENGDIIGQTNPNRIGQRWHDFGTCTAAPQPALSSFPSIYPLLRPPQYLSYYPSATPTVVPTATPSIIPNTLLSHQHQARIQIFSHQMCQV